MSREDFLPVYLHVRNMDVQTWYRRLFRAQNELGIKPQDCIITREYLQDLLTKGSTTPETLSGISPARASF